MKIYTEFKKIAEQYSTRIAIDDGKKSLSYTELLKQIDQCADKLSQQGWTKNHQLGFLSKNENDFLVYYFAANKLNICFSALDYQFSIEELNNIINFIKIDGLIISHGAKDKFNKEFISADQSLLSWQIDNSYDNNTEFHTGPIDKVNTPNRGEQLANISSIQLSSGSTGLPKAIMIDEASSIFRVTDTLAPFELDKEKTLCVVPLSHSHGIDCLALTTLFTGGTLFLKNFFETTPLHILKTIEKKEITFFSAIPNFYEFILALNLKETVNLNSLKLLFCGSAALSESTAEKFFKTFNKALLQGYGLAELGIISVNQQKEEPFKFSSVGNILPGVQFKIDIRGELQVKSKALAKGYLDQQEYFDSRWTSDGYFKTGDLVQYQNNFLYITGRADDCINIAGLKVYPIEIEMELNKLPWISESAVKADTGNPEKIICFIPSTPSLSSDWREKTKEALQKELVGYKISAEFILIKEFPKSPLGKILKAKLNSGMGI